MILRSADVRSAIRNRQRGFIIDPFKFAAAGPPQPTFSNVELLLHMDDSDGSTTFTDSSSNARTVTPVGASQIDTAQSKFGGSSGLLDGSGDYLSVSTANSLNIRTQAFCLEGWMRFVTQPGTSTFISAGASGTDLYVTWFTGTLYFGDGSSNPIVVASAPNSGIWHHIACTFDTTTYRVFINGTEIGSTTSLLLNKTVSAWQIGGLTGNGWYHDGWMDDVRITFNEAVYTADFTPPTSPHPDS